MNLFVIGEWTCQACGETARQEVELLLYRDEPRVSPDQPSGWLNGSFCSEQCAALYKAKEEQNRIEYAAWKWDARVAASRRTITETETR